MSKSVIVLGSVTPPGRLLSALNAVVERTSGVEVIDLGQRRLDFADGRPPADHDDDSSAIIESVSSADAVVMATPVYRGTYTGALKNLLDLLPIESLRGKPVGIVAMGATQHHYLGAEWHLRDVLAWFGALAAPTAVYLTSADFKDGAPTDAAIAELEALLGTLDRLAAATKGIELGPSPLAAKGR